MAGISCNIIYDFLTLLFDASLRCLFCGLAKQPKVQHSGQSARGIGDALLCYVASQVNVAAATQGRQSHDSWMVSDQVLIVVASV